jgi:hypothetical protein
VSSYNGSTCDALKMESYACGTGGLCLSNGTATWGGSVVQADDGSWHMFAAMMTENKTLQAGDMYTRPRYMCFCEKRKPIFPSLPSVLLSICAHCEPCPQGITSRVANVTLWLYAVGYFKSCLAFNSDTFAVVVRCSMEYGFGQAWLSNSVVLHAVAPAGGCIQAHTHTLMHKHTQMHTRTRDRIFAQSVCLCVCVCVCTRRGDAFELVHHPALVSASDKHVVYDFSPN